MVERMALTLTGTGIWSGELRRHADRAEVADAAAELEQLGYSALWFPAGDARGGFDAAGELLRATSSVTVATGILSVWVVDPEVCAAERAQLHDAYDGRFLLGLGVSHERAVGSDRYKRPLAKMRSFLDSLDVAAPAVLPEERALAALGPKMLELARERSLGAHPYLVTPEHTRTAREAIGPEKLLAVEQAVVLDTDPERARALAREHLEIYLQLPNYANNWRRLGFGDEDIEGGGSDRLVDALVAWGDLDAVRARVDAHREAGADQVLVQAVSAGDGLPRDEWRELAPVLNA
jgi:probable F420-dependent oxidoreductase